MKIKILGTLVLLSVPLYMQAQGRPTTVTTSPTATAGTRVNMVYHGELGKWWQNSDIAKKFNWSDDQIGTSSTDVLRSQGQATPTTARKLKNRI